MINQKKGLEYLNSLANGLVKLELEAREEATYKEIYEPKKDLEDLPQPKDFPNIVNPDGSFKEENKFVPIYPTLRGFVDKEGKINVWCDSCKKWHKHGKEEGYRTPQHCKTNTQGYQIKLFSKEELLHFLPYLKETLKETLKGEF